jgi:type IV pilus assembly protein PilV
MLTMPLPSTAHPSCLALRRCPGPARTQAGLSLIEVMVAVLIFSFGLLGIVALQARTTQASVSAEDTHRAALLADDLAARMWNAGTVALPAATLEDWRSRVGRPADGGLPAGTGEVAVDIAERRAEIVITWRPPGAPPSQALSRYATQVVMPPNTL